MIRFQALRHCRLPLLILSSLLLADASAWAATQDKNEQLLQALKTHLPEMKVERVQPSPVAGFYEAVVGDNIFYVDATGQFVFNGQLIDIKDKSNLTMLAKAGIKKIDPAALPLNDAFTIVRGNGKRHLYVFSDPDCPYCKSLEQKELPRITDVTIHVFLFPLVELHPDAFKKSVGVWCADQKEQAWQNVMLRDVAPPSKECVNPVERNVALGKKLGINATPTLVFEDGKVLPGAVPAIQLEMMLNKAKS